VDRFVLVSANEITDADLALGNEARFRIRSWTGPHLVAVELPKDPKELNDLTFSTGAGGHDVQDMPKYYRDFAAAGTSLLVNAKPLEVLRKKRSDDPDALAQIAQGIAATGRDAAALLWVPVEARKNDLAMLIDAKTAEPLKAVSVEPW
jgi:hypothetical protein